MILKTLETEDVSFERSISEHDKDIHNGNPEREAVKGVEVSFMRGEVAVETLCILNGTEH